LLQPLGLLAKAKRTLLPAESWRSGSTLALATSEPKIASEEEDGFISLKVDFSLLFGLDRSAHAL